MERSTRARFWLEMRSRRFGPFELLPESLELRREGDVVPLRPQLAKALVLLSSRPGRIVTREELRALLWADTVVDFDKSLNFVILQLRRALGDDAAHPRYVETVPRRGYRFVASMKGERARWVMPMAVKVAWVLVVVGSMVLAHRWGGGASEESGTSNVEARAAYLKGRYLLDKGARGDFEQALDYLQEAVAVDPDFAEAWLTLAHAGLRRTFITGTDGDIARAAVDRALEANPRLALAHVRLGDVRSVVDWDWEGAGRAYERALELDPELAEAHHHYASYLMIRGDVDAAVRAVELAVELDPVSVSVLGDAGWKYLYLGRIGEALTHCEKTLDLEPASAHALECLVYAHQQQGDVRAALAAARRHLETLGVDTKLGGPVSLDVYRALVLDRLEARGAGVSPVDLALAHAGVGNAPAALEHLQEAQRRRLIRLVFQIRDPRLREVRHEPDFPALVRALGVAHPL